jgi:hypothetical protein
MKTVSFFVYSVIVIQLISCQSSHQTNPGSNSILTDHSKYTFRNESSFNSIYQNSSSHWGSISDSVVLTRRNSYENYNRISIYRQDKLIFEYTDEYLEVIGMPYSLFVEQEITFHKEYYYIFKLFGGFQFERYLIIKTTPDSTFIFGKTDMNSALLFGDIDFDGNFEIGGFSDLCEDFDNHICPDTSLFVVFEIRDGFPKDLALTRYFRRLLIKK